MLPPRELDARTTPLHREEVSPSRKSILVWTSNLLPFQEPILSSGGLATLSGRVLFGHTRQGQRPQQARVIPQRGTGNDQAL